MWYKQTSTITFKNGCVQCFGDIIGCWDSHGKLIITFPDSPSKSFDIDTVSQYLVEKYISKSTAVLPTKEVRMQ